MELSLTTEERTQLELIALHAGKSTPRVLMEAAEFLLEHDIDALEWMLECRRGPSYQTFLCDEDMDLRLAQLLGR
jgi:hypothetical protein